ncbi:hypothetical protein ABK040_001097 [Willaertia magna]
MYSCGSNQSSQLCTRFISKELLKEFTPMTNIKNLLKKEEKINQIEGSLNFTLVLTNKNRIFVVGENTWGQLGCKFEQLKKSVPIENKVLDDKGQSLDVLKIACGEEHSIILTRDNKVYSCGGNSYGQLGIKQIDFVNKFTNILLLDEIINVTCGEYHTMFISKNRDIYAAGRNYYGQLGLEDNTDRYIPTKINFFNKNLKEGDFITQIKCGGAHSFFLSQFGQVFSCGMNLHGQLGLPYPIKECNTPKKVNIEHVVQIECGIWYTLFLNLFGEIYGCGTNQQGQLGLGLNKKEYKNLITKINFQKIVNEIHCGSSHSILITNDNEIYVFGENQNYGQLGLGDLENRFVPTPLLSNRKSNNNTITHTSIDMKWRVFCNVAGNCTFLIEEPFGKLSMIEGFKKHLRSDKLTDCSVNCYYH